MFEEPGAGCFGPRVVDGEAGTFGLKKRTLKWGENGGRGDPFDQSWNGDSVTDMLLS